RALEDADDAALGAAAFLDALDADDDAVAVHRFVHQLAGDVDVAAVVERPLGGDEPVARRMRLQPADVEIHLLGQSEAVAADLNEVAGADERFDVALERRAVVARDFENLQELAHAGGMVNPLAHHGEDLIAGKHRIYVNRRTWRSPTFVPVGPVWMRSPSASKNAKALLSDRKPAGSSPA